MFGANFVILAQICDELSRGQAEFPINLSKMAKMTLKVKVNDLHFLYQPRVSQDACLEQIWWFLLKSVTSYRGQAEFPIIVSKNGQNDLEGQCRWSPFSIPADSIPGCMFRANLVIPAQTYDQLLCRQGKVYGQTDGWTDGQTDAGNDNTPSAWKTKGEKWKNLLKCQIF